ncbi:MAG: hypothetical protein DKT66_19405 [Candidatus Melainabacteria bacterium]|nr:MAG: hypothetical protein DKT66_19405 [Candidatus Melainabacteria bacterium]
MAQAGKSLTPLYIHRFLEFQRQINLEKRPLTTFFPKEDLQVDIHKGSWQADFCLKILASKFQPPQFGKLPKSQNKHAGANNEEFH